MTAREIPHSPPLIIGHRGASARAPENTLAAFALALRGGADGVEFDVRLSSDRVPVVIHDASLNRTARTEALVADLTSAELRRLDAGTWFNLRNPAHSRDEFALEGVPSLDEVLDFVAPTSQVAYVELKCEEGEDHEPLARAVVERIRGHCLQDRAIVKCFRHEAIRYVKRLAPGIRTAALFGRKFSRPLLPARAILEAALGCGADEVSLQRPLVRRAVVEAASSRGLATLVWTVDDTGYLRRARELGLRALFTNDPAQMRSALESATAAGSREY